MVDTNDEWITTRVGIKQRRILHLEGEGSSYLGIRAVNRLLEATGVNPEEIDLLICATSNPDYRFPSTGSVIAYQCKLSNAYAYDIQGACAGFLVALQDAAAYIRSGMYKKIVVVAAEKMSSMTKYVDRTLRGACRHYRRRVPHQRRRSASFVDEGRRIRKACHS